MWQHVKLSVQIRPWDTLACCWDGKQPTSNNNRPWDTLACCWDVKQPTNNNQITVRATTLRKKLQIELSFSPNLSILTAGQPVSVLTSPPGRAATDWPTNKQALALLPFADCVMRTVSCMYRSDWQTWLIALTNATHLSPTHTETLDKTESTVCVLFNVCFAPKQHAGVSHGRICSD